MPKNADELPINGETSDGDEIALHGGSFCLAVLNQDGALALGGLVVSNGHKRVHLLLWKTTGAGQRCQNGAVSSDGEKLRRLVARVALAAELLRQPSRARQAVLLMICRMKSEAGAA